MQSMILAVWTIREYLAAFTLICLVIFPVIAMWRFFVKGPDEKKAE